MASGTTREPEPPPQLPNVDEAQRLYIYGSDVHLPAPVIFGAGWHSQLRPVTHTPWDRLVNQMADELGRLQALEPGWDGRKARPITYAALRGMLDVLASLLDHGSQPPQIFPLPSGGIHIEWLAGGDEIEIDIDNRGCASVVAESATGDLIAEGQLDLVQPSALMGRVATFLQAISVNVAAHNRRD